MVVGSFTSEHEVGVELPVVVVVSESSSFAHPNANRRLNQKNNINLKILISF